MRLHWIAVVVAPCMLACAHSSEPEPSLLTVTQVSAVLVNDVNDPAWPADLITLDSAVVTDDGRLRLFTQYGGGCQDHAAALVVETAFAESFPPRLRARIAHNAKNDMCKALLFWTLEFDLKPVRDHYRASYGSGPGALVLNISGRLVTYSFQ